MNVTLWPIDRPVPYARNARKIPQSAIDKVAASIKEFGWRQPVVVDSEGIIIAGHTRLLAARKLGMTEVPVHIAEGLTAAQIKAYRLMDNRSHQETDWETELIGPELLDLKALGLDLTLTGFEQNEIDGFLAQIDASEGLTDPDAVPAAPEFPVTEPGDLWILGRHRLLCGDSTSIDAVERLMGGEKADMVFTDPPYGISVVRRNKVGGGGALKFTGTDGASNWVDAKDYAEIANDDSTDTAREFYQTCQAAGLQDYIIWGGNYFTDFLPPSACWLVWDKQNTGNFADVELAWCSLSKGAKLYPFLWNGLAREGDRKSELKTRVHPTQKPVGLFEKIFSDFLFKSCFDGFLGSGSTLIACEKTGRACFGMEMSADYCDVILQRWADFTGKQPTLDGDGRTFAELKSERFLVKLGAQDQLKEEAELHAPTSS